MRLRYIYKIILMVTFMTVGICGMYAADDEVSPSEPNPAVTAQTYESVLHIVESVGVAEASVSNENRTLHKGESIGMPSTVWTGLHSSVSLSDAGDSVITVNQLAKLTFVGAVRTDKGMIYSIDADSGFIIVNSHPIGELPTIMNVKTAVGELVCTNFVGQIYIGADHGILITVSEGKVSVRPKIKTFYSLRKGGMCAITKDGYLIDNDKLIRGKITSVPSNVVDAESLSLFINRISGAYTNERYTNDFFDNRHR